MDNKKTLPVKRPKGTWIQTDREAHEAWALLAKKPAASAVMHMLCAKIGDYNAVVISQAELAKLCEISSRSVKRGIADLVAGNWIEVVRIGKTGQTNAYVINDRVAWHGPRKGIRKSEFSARIIATSEEQPNADLLGKQKPLRRMPFLDEGQIPSGPGLPPPSQPDFEGMEVDLPAAGYSNKFESGGLLPPPDLDEKTKEKALLIAPGIDARGIYQEWRRGLENTRTDDPESDFLNYVREYAAAYPDAIRSR